MAAHLHDSVLQTLALIQRSSDDPATVARLARAQERDLRSWLFDDAGKDPDTLSAALRAVAAEVEDAHGVPVEVVCVGDARSPRRTAPLVLASREAMANAAKHSGAGTVDVYAEATPGRRRGLRPRPRPRLRPRRGRRRPAGRPRQHRRPDGAARRHAPRSAAPRRGHRGPALDAEPAHSDRRRPAMTLARVVIVDDHAMFRTGVRAELGDRRRGRRRGGRRRPGRARGHRAPAGGRAARRAPARAVAGAEVMRVRRRQAAPSTRFLALSVSDAAEDVIGTIRAGARGYVTKTITGPELVAAIERVASGDAVFSPRLAGFVLDAFAGTIEVAAGRRGPRPPHRARARGDAPDRAWLLLQGGRRRAVHLDQDRRDPHVARCCASCSSRRATS